MKYNILNRDTGAVLFTAEIDCVEEDTDAVKLGNAVVCAVKHNVDLIRADLRGVDLTEADFSDACFRDSDLSNSCFIDADLSRAEFNLADLTDADMRGATLRDADLSGAILHGADLRGADLCGADLLGAGIAVIHTDMWTVYVHQENIRIGYRLHAADAWWSMDDRNVNHMGLNAVNWWHRWKPAIKAAHEALCKGDKR